jgi:hypothetical protein
MEIVELLVGDAGKRGEGVVFDGEEEDDGCLGVCLKFSFACPRPLVNASNKMMTQRRMDKCIRDGRSGTYQDTKAVRKIEKGISGIFGSAPPRHDSEEEESYLISDTAISSRTASSRSTHQSTWRLRPFQARTAMAG